VVGYEDRGDKAVDGEDAGEDSWKQVYAMKSQQ
jgi:hypothetical protein